MSLPCRIEIVAARPEDQPAVIALIDEVYREYGDRVFLQGAEADLQDLQKHYFSNDGIFWVVKVSGEVVGTVAVQKTGPGTRAALKRFYLKKAHRGSGIADQMLDTALRWCVANGVSHLYFWSDTRFTRGHRFYQKHGFRRGPTRTMNDGFLPYREYYFERELGPQTEAPPKKTTKNDSR